MVLPRSYRFQVALIFALLALCSVGLLGAFLLNQGYRLAKTDRLAGAQRSSVLLAANIASALYEDDLWQVYRSIQRYVGDSRDEVSAVAVLDRDHRIYATTIGPARDYLGRPANALGAAFPTAAHLSAIPHQALVREREGGFLVASPIMRDGEVLGTLMVHYSLQALLDGIRILIRRGAILVLCFLLVMVAAGAWLGAHLVRPVTQLGRCMGEVGRGNLRVSCRLQDQAGEIGDLGRGFEEMRQGLCEREAIIGEMIQAKRLAAVGRVAAGVAHEINNPLGGMMNALDTYRRHRDDPEIERSTLTLLERGLDQIHHTVRALLVEAKPQDRMLCTTDFEDLLTLIKPTAQAMGVGLDWCCVLPDAVMLPATQIRQVVMNLVLNALHATGKRGNVRFVCQLEDSHLVLTVTDDGPGFSPEQRDHMFEPFVSGFGHTGLGLWVSYQIITGLGGHIALGDVTRGACLKVSIPMDGDRT